MNEFDRVPTLWQPNVNGRPHRVTASGLAEIPFGPGRKFASSGVLGAILGGWQVGSTLEYQPGPLLAWGLRTSSSTANSTDIPSDDPTLERWFNVDAGFERDPLKVPANFQKRVFPFRIDGVRGPNLLQVNMNLMRTVRLPGTPCAELPRGHHQPPESDDVRQPESESGDHRLRAHHGRDGRFTTVHPIRGEAHLLEQEGA